MPIRGSKLRKFYFDGLYLKKYGENLMFTNAEKLIFHLSIARITKETLSNPSKYFQILLDWNKYFKLTEDLRETKRNFTSALRNSDYFDMKTTKNKGHFSATCRFLTPYEIEAKQAAKRSKYNASSSAASGYGSGDSNTTMDSDPHATAAAASVLQNTNADPHIRRKPPENIEEEPINTFTDLFSDLKSFCSAMNENIGDEAGGSIPQLMPNPDDTTERFNEIWKEHLGSPSNANSEDWTLQSMSPEMNEEVTNLMEELDCYCSTNSVTKNIQLNVLEVKEVRDLSITTSMLVCKYTTLYLPLEVNIEAPLLQAYSGIIANEMLMKKLLEYSIRQLIHNDQGIDFMLEKMDNPLEGYQRLPFQNGYYVFLKADHFIVAEL